jgi:hypothetical protein
MLRFESQKPLIWGLGKDHVLMENLMEVHIFSFDSADLREDENAAGQFGLFNMPKWTLDGASRSGGSAGPGVRYTVGLLVKKTFKLLEHETTFAGGFRSVNSQGSLAIVDGQFRNNEGQEKWRQKPKPSIRQRSTTKLPRICATCKHFMTGPGEFESAIHVVSAGRGSSGVIKSSACPVLPADYQLASVNAWAYLTKKEKETLRKHSWDMYTYNLALAPE